MSDDVVVPPIKWAGGKRWLALSYPSLFKANYQTYIEPFFGGGAIFFHILPKTAILNDVNHALMEVYRAIRDNHHRVQHHLELLASRHSDHFYYAMRDHHFRGRYQRAAQFLYLNRTCWNGLYRVNKQGYFNVPRGTKNDVLLDTDDFEAIAFALEAAHIHSDDFEGIVDMATAGDFLFVDPPYAPAENQNETFGRYHRAAFEFSDHSRLRDALQRAAVRGAIIVVTHGHNTSIADLYRGFGDVMFVKRNMAIGRGHAAAQTSCATEMVIAINHPMMGRMNRDALGVA